MPRNDGVESLTHFTQTGENRYGKEGEDVGEGKGLCGEEVCHAPVPATFEELTK
jgi:hypothetical protein